MEKIFKGYWKSRGKIPLYAEEQRELLSEPPAQGDYCGVLNDGLVRIDIDDFSHSDGTLQEPINDAPRSNAIIAYLDTIGAKYVGIATTNGVHLIFKKPTNFQIEKNKLNWFAAIGVRAEWHVTKPFEPMRVGGTMREVFRSSESVDELPAGLLPIQKSKNRPFSMKFQTGDRNNHLSEYAFHLAKIGFSPEEVKQTVEAMNSFVLENPLSDSEIETILRPETMEKIAQVQRQNDKQEISPALFAEWLQSVGMKIKYNELFNIVEYENAPKTAEFENISDTQNAMPIAIQYSFKEWCGRPVSRLQIQDLIFLEADKNAFHPVRDFLSATRWDGVDRFEQLFDVLGVSDDFEQTLVKKWFYQAAAMPFNSLKEPFQSEGVLILQGREGIGKSRFFQKIAVCPTWFSSFDKEFSTNEKDSIIQILSSWIVELGEVDRSFRANRSDIKSFITSRDDTIRKPYRPEPTRRARTTSICATTNSSTFLNTDAGSRRWWVVHIPKKINLDSLSDATVKQLWAQCYATWKENPLCFRLTDSEQEELQQRNRGSRELLPAEEELRTRFNFDAPKNQWHWTTCATLIDLPQYDVTRYKPREIGAVLSRFVEDGLGIERKRTKGVTKYLVPPCHNMTDAFRNRAG